MKAWAEKMTGKACAWIVAALPALAVALASMAAPLPRVDTDEGFALFQQKSLGCHGNAAAATGIPCAVLNSGADGRITGLSQRDGRCLWTLETARNFDTVNHVPAHGGSLIGSGVTVSGGMMFIGSGYAIANGAPGNVLLAYSIL